MKTKSKTNEILILWMMVIVHTLVLYYICDFQKALETYQDELIYYNLAKCLADGRAFEMHGMALDFTNIAYSLLISPLFWITDVTLRIHLITLTNSFLLSVSIVPVWLICGELQASKKIKWLVVFIIMLYPSMAFAGTFMTENLYWPLTLFTYYYIVRTIKSGRASDAFIAGVLSFFSYFCKEVGICIFLAAVAWFLISPLDSYIFENQSNDVKKENFAKYYVSHIDWKNLVRYILSFAIIYLAVNKIILSGIENTYVANPEKYLSVLKNNSLPKVIIYLLYAVVLYLVYTLTAFFVVPVIYPILKLREMNNTIRKVYLYSLVLLAGTVLTIVCTISLKEDFGDITPRVHMRYFSSIIGLMTSIFGSVISSEKQKNCDKKFWMLLGIYFIFFIFIFKGVHIGSCVDCVELGYSSYLLRKYGVINIGELRVYVAGIMCSIFVGVMIAVMYILSKIKMKYVYNCFYVIVVFACLLNFQKSYEVIKVNYMVSQKFINNVEQISNYFTDNDIKDKIVLFVCDQWYTKAPKVFDTYFIGEHTYEVGFNQFIETLNSIEDSCIANYTFINPVKGRSYSLENIDYFITEHGGFQNVVGNLEYLEDVSSENYFVYKNTQPTMVCPLNNIIDFTGKRYSTIVYDVEGMSNPEGAFTWTDGNEMSMSCRFSKDVEQVKVQINVTGTFNGVQNYTIYQDNVPITEGSISGSGQISADLTVVDGDCSFKIELPNAVSPYSLGESEDRRVLAMAISSMEFITED